MKIAMDMIEIGTRLRGADAGQVARIAASVAEVGLLSPVTVYQRQIVRAGIAVNGWGLVAGLHRLEACRSLGHVEIEANVVTLGELDRQIAECDENLCGARLSPSERAMFTHRRKDAYEAKHPEARHGGDRRSSRQVGDLNDADRFTADTAAKTGRSERAIQRDATRGERVAEDVLAALAGTAEDTGAALDELVTVPRAEQQGRLAEIRARPAVAPERILERRQRRPAASATPGAAALTAEQTEDRDAVIADPIYPVPALDQRDQMPRFMGWDRYEWAAVPEQLADYFGMRSAWEGWQDEREAIAAEGRDNDAAMRARAARIIAECGTAAERFMESNRGGLMALFSAYEKDPTLGGKSQKGRRT